jgi:hypothetical protein
LARHHPCMMVRRSEGLHSLDVVWVKWLFRENSVYKENTDTISSCNSLHTGYKFFHSSQYVRFVKTYPYLSRNWFLDILWLGLFCSFKWVLYPLKACNPFLTLYNPVIAEHTTENFVSL